MSVIRVPKCAMLVGHRDGGCKCTQPAVSLSSRSCQTKRLTDREAREGKLAALTGSLYPSLPQLRCVGHARSPALKKTGIVDSGYNIKSPVHDAHTQAPVHGCTCTCAANGMYFAFLFHYFFQSLQLVRRDGVCCLSHCPLCTPIIDLYHDAAIRCSCPVFDSRLAGWPSAVVPSSLPLFLPSLPGAEGPASQPVNHLELKHGNNGQ
ncbi:unnamed protein product [Periconia digitata]|uniref:Uncharacterized protein n=1 Tax=Periconia digitata TaxID=1303443 RepID=A0A9W4UEZ3_9PLEO|nr:unnamed protein product [Periconia digitata]